MAITAFETVPLPTVVFGHKVHGKVPVQGEYVKTTGRLYPPVNPTTDQNG